MKKFLTICVTALVAGASFAQSFNKEKLDSYFDALEQGNKFMGSAALSENGKLIYTRAVGYSDLENRKKSDINTKYRIGSISKTFTSVLTFMAIEDNKLSLDTKLIKYFPGIKNAEQITIGNLLNHRSGIHNFTDDEKYLSYNTQKQTEQQMLNLIAAGGSDFTPDTKADYSNSNYVLLSFILEKVYKKSYGALLQDKILIPAGLKNTFFGGQINVKNNEANSYKFEAGWKKETETDTSIPLGAGGIVSTPSDLLQFSTVLFEGKLVSLKNLELMKTMNDDFGYGLFQIPFGDKISYGHSGGIDEFTSVFSYFPIEKTGIALTSNGAVINNNEVALVMLSAAFGKSYTIPEFNTIKLSAKELSEYTGTYSSKEIPLKITITVENDQLVAHADGQSALPLESSKKNIFTFDPAGIELVFDPALKTMILNQGGGSFNFTKE